MRLRGLFRTQLVLMLFEQRILDEWVPLFAYGEHVSDPRAFGIRLSHCAWRLRPDRTTT